MKIACKGGTIDLDALNRFDPDGRGPFCAVMAAGYEGPVAPHGPYLETTDNGRVACADLALKLAFDLCIRAGLRCMKYLLAETGRGCVLNTDGERALSAHTPDMPDDPAYGLLDAAGAISPLLPDTSLCVPRNLRALDEYNVLNGLLEAGFEGVLAVISDYAWLGASMSFLGLCEALTAVLSSMMPDDTRIFLERLYGAMDKAGAEPAAQTDVGRDMDGTDDEPAMDDGDAETGDGVPADAPEDDEEADPDNEDGEASGSAFQAPKMPSVTHPIERLADPYADGVHVKGLSASDITGLDETYTMEYCEHVYERDLSTRDSEGFFEGVLKARLNGTAAPIDLLSESVSRAGGEQASQLKRTLSQLAEDARDAVGGEI